MRLKNRSLAALLVAACALPVAVPAAQAQDNHPLAIEAAASPADVNSVDGILAALYNVISGPAGKQRDWNRLRSLFAPTAHMVVIGNRPEGASPATAMTVDEFVGRVTKAVAEEGFYESEVARSTEAFGPLVHVFSTYESRHAPGDAKPFQRGINSLQLTFDGRRWWIANLVWRAETAQQPLPARYAPRR